MPQNNRESLIFTIIMCFTMVLWMSMYNVTLAHGRFFHDCPERRMAGIPLRLHLRHVL